MGNDKLQDVLQREKRNAVKGLYACLAKYGFSFADEESGKIIDGTHELYAKEVESEGV